MCQIWAHLLKEMPAVTVLHSDEYSGIRGGGAPLIDIRPNRLPERFWCSLGSD